MAQGPGQPRVTIADGADVAQGTTTDAAVITDVSGTLSAKLRGIVKLLAGTLTVAGTVTANLGTIAGIALDATVVAVRDRLPASLDADGGLKTHVQNFPATQPVSAASLPLPTGAATDASLTTIDTDLKAIQPRDLHTQAKGGSSAGYPTSEDLDANHRGLTVVPFGSNGAYLQQRASTFDLVVQLRNNGLELDPRDVADRAARLLGHVTIDEGSDITEGLRSDAAWDGGTGSPTVVSILKAVGGNQVSERQALERQFLQAYAQQMNALDPGRGYEVR